jgi:hypothetical protein
MKNIKNYKYFLKEELDDTPITFEDIFDSIIDYIDDGKIEVREIKHSKRFSVFRSLLLLEHCLISEGKLQKDPFGYINSEPIKSDLEIDYKKAVSIKNSSNTNRCFYFELSIDERFANDFNIEFIDKMNLYKLDSTLVRSMALSNINKEPDLFKLIMKRRLIFEILSKVFSKTSRIYNNLNFDMFYRIASLSNESFAKIEFKVEF